MAERPNKQRTPQACNPCRKRKIKCSGARPSCRNCIRLQIQCLWRDDDNNTAAVASSSTRPEEHLLPTFSDFKALVSADQATRLVDIFFTTQCISVTRWPIHRPRFVEATQPTLLLISIYFLAALFITHHDVVELFNGEAALSVSERIGGGASQLSRITSDQVSVSAVQANLILCFRELLCRQGRRAWMSAGLAVRMAQQLRLGREYHQRHGVVDQETRRRTMWTCFIVDRLVAFTTSRPQAIRTHQLSIQLPCPEDKFLFGEPCEMPKLSAFAANQTESREALVYFIKVVHLWGKITTAVAEWAIIAPGKEDTLSAVRLQITKVADEVESLKSGMPPRLQWSQSNYDSFRILGNEDQFVMTNMLIRYALCLAKQAFLPHEATQAPAIEPDSYRCQVHDVLTCLESSHQIVTIARCLYDGDERDRAALLSPFIGIALSGSANILVWVTTVLPILLQEGQLQELSMSSYLSNARSGLDFVSLVIQSNSGTIPLASAWLETINFLQDFYAVAYGGTQRIDDHYSEEEPAQESLTSTSAVGIPDSEAMTSSRTLSRQALLLITGALEPSAVRTQQAQAQIRSIWNRLWLQAQTEMPDEWLLSMADQDEFADSFTTL